MDEMFRLELTDEQQASFSHITGLRKRTVEVTHRRLGAFALAAAAAGSEVLPISGSPETIRHMLAGEARSRGADTPFIVWIRLTPEQTEQIRSAVGRTMRSVAVAPAEEMQHVGYVERWDQTGPLQVGSLVIVPDGAVPPTVPMDRLIRLPVREGLNAFGTGRHPATRAALAELEACLRPGDSVLDVGTGSGILAIAAIRLGASRAVGVDTDPKAVALAREAVALNGLEARIEILAGSLETVQDRFDVIVMNLLPDIIMQLAPALEHVTHSRTRIVTSGITEARSKRLARGMAAHGFELREQRADDNWVGQLYQRREAAPELPAYSAT